MAASSQDEPTHIAACPDSYQQAEHMSEAGHAAPAPAPAGDDASQEASPSGITTASHPRPAAEHTYMHASNIPLSTNPQPSVSSQVPARPDTEAQASRSSKGTSQEGTSSANDQPTLELDGDAQNSRGTGQAGKSSANEQPPLEQLVSDHQHEAADVTPRVCSHEADKQPAGCGIMPQSSPLPLQDRLAANPDGIDEAHQQADEGAVSSAGNTIAARPVRDNAEADAAAEAGSQEGLKQGAADRAPAISQQTEDPKPSKENQAANAGRLCTHLACPI